MDLVGGPNAYRSTDRGQEPDPLKSLVKSVPSTLTQGGQGLEFLGRYMPNPGTQAIDHTVAFAGMALNERVVHRDRGGKPGYGQRHRPGAGHGGE